LSLLVDDKCFIFQATRLHSAIQINLKDKALLSALENEVLDPAFEAIE
jgi:hypothetical protein